MTLRIGIIGAGRSGFQETRRLQNYPEVAVTAVAETSRPKRDAYVRSFGIKLAVADYRKLADNKSIDTVCICTPPSTHADIALECLAGGKHVVCMPPISIDIDRAAEMISAADESDGQLFVALPSRYDPYNQTLQRMIAEEDLGYPFLVIASYIENEYDRLNDWHDWIGTWETGGGGILMDRGSGVIDLLQYLLGRIESVTGECARFAIDALNKAEDTCLLNLLFEEETSVQLAFTGAARYLGDHNHQLRIEVHGVEAAATANNSDPRLLVTKRGHSPVPIGEAEIVSHLPNDMWGDFIRCMTTEKAPLVTADDALNALRVILATYKSSLMKRRVETMERL